MLKRMDGKKEIWEIGICFFLMLAFTVFVGWLERTMRAVGIWTGILAYLIQGAALIIYVLKVEKSPVTSVGLQKIRFWDILGGLLLGFAMFAAQQIPLLLMKMDYTGYAMQPDPVYIVVMSLYCILCVGLVEELIFRGFILSKTLAVCDSKILSIGINILLFYVIHWSSMQFTFGEFYSIAVNVILLCAYYFKSKHKSIVPLIIAHSLYDILTSVLLPIIIFLSNNGS